MNFGVAASCRPTRGTSLLYLRGADRARPYARPASDTRRSILYRGAPAYVAYQQGSTVCIPRSLTSMSTFPRIARQERAALSLSPTVHVLFIDVQYVVARGMRPMQGGMGAIIGEVESE